MAFNFDFLNDPNMQKLMMQIGAGMSRGEPAGEYLGKAGTTYTENKALQQATAKQSQREETLRNKLLKAIYSGELLNGKDKNDKFDTITMDGDGGINLAMKHVTPETTPGFKGEQRAPEARPQQRPQAIEAPGDAASFADYLDSPTALTEENLAGLGPQEIGMLMQAQAGAGSQQQQALRTLLGERQAGRADRFRTEKLASDEEQAMRSARAKIVEQGRKTEEKQKTATMLYERQREMAGLREELQRTRPEKVDPIRQQQVDISQARLEIAERAEAGDIEYAKAIEAETIISPDTDRVQAKLKAEMSNQDPDGDYVFYEDTTGFNNMDLWRIPEDLMYNGVKVTPPMLVELAKESGMSFENFIEKIKEQ